MTPGTYLRKRREAADVTPEDVARMVAAVIEQPGPWLSEIENDDRAPSATSVGMLIGTFDFDRHVLDRLIDLHYFAADLPEPRLCRTCACSQWDPCVTDLRGSGSCHWVAEDLCSACTGGGAVEAMPVPTNDVAGVLSAVERVA